MECATTIRHTVEIAAWSVDVTGFMGLAVATSLWGTERRHAGLLLHDALNSAAPTIWDSWRDPDGTEHREINAQETEAAKEKLAKIKAAFEDWIWRDAERTDRLARIYNDRFNDLVPRHFDGSHLTLPGASSAIVFRPFQLRGVWRIISAGSTYLAHAVGAGKTFLMAAAIMEQKRLGLISKAMMVVPGHCLAQASREFLLLYPNARILVADETNFVASKRQRFVARAATAKWDCIILTHAAFKFIATPAAFEEDMVCRQIGAYAGLLEHIGGDDRITRKRIENLKEKLQEKLEALKARKDDMLTIAEIGVDQLVIDEAQEFRKLNFTTNMTTLKGVQPDGSQRAWDLYVKSRFIDTVNPGRALVMASGTPITNTLVTRPRQKKVLIDKGSRFGRRSIRLTGGRQWRIVSSQTNRRAGWSGALGFRFCSPMICDILTSRAVSFASGPPGFGAQSNARVPPTQQERDYPITLSMRIQGTSKTSGRIWKPERSVGRR
jgi:N12 class adenine-specific DNA methylase